MPNDPSPMCKARVYRGNDGLRSIYGDCNKRASVETDGVWTCKTHSPAAIAARRAKGLEKSRAAFAERRARYIQEQMERESLPIVRDLVAWSEAEDELFTWNTLVAIIERARAVLAKETK